MYQKYASWNSSKERKEENKSYQGKSFKLSSYSSKDHKHSSSHSKDHKHSSSSKDHISSFSSPKPKFKEKSSFLKCFKCLGYGHKAYNYPNNRVMMIKNREIQSEHSSSSPSSPSSCSLFSLTKSTSSSNGNFELHPERGDSLVVRKMLGKVHKYIGGSQKENIFYS